METIIPRMRSTLMTNSVEGLMVIDMLLRTARSLVGLGRKSSTHGVRSQLPQSVCETRIYDTGWQFAMKTDFD